MDGEGLTTAPEYLALGLSPCWAPFDGDVTVELTFLTLVKRELVDINLVPD